MTLRKTYYPSRIFDDDQESFARMVQDKGWEFPRAAIERLIADVDAQRRERAELDAQYGRYVALRETFGLAQSARYQRFMALLNAARGMFREDKAVTAELERFAREVGGRRKKTPAETEEAA